MSENNIIQITNHIKAEIRKGSVALHEKGDSMGLISKTLLIIDSDELKDVAEFLLKISKQWKKKGW
jgi:hypothetical protein